MLTVIRSVISRQMNSHTTSIFQLLKRSRVDAMLRCRYWTKVRKHYGSGVSGQLIADN